ncbi:MAG: 7-cyano-7-deazaguanine synthase [Syntrophales bacterium]|nr:7-cyano-7-deazaguanine synthase [Syntrophales bacterium]
MICARCVLPESPPDIRLDTEGICNVCREEEKEKAGGDSRSLLETDFVRMLNQYRGRNRYDCLVMCSGGKDSTYSLYLMKKKYAMTPLAFTFDHGFETEDAMENVKNAVESLGVDFLFFKTDYMKDMFARMITSHSKAVLCHPCSIWYMQLTFEIAAQYGIPLIIAGWTKGQSTTQNVMTKCACNISSPEYISMSKATKVFLETLKDDSKYRYFPKSVEEVLTAARKRHKSTVLSPHWFLKTDPDEYTEILKREVGWKYPSLSYPAKSTNCYLNFLSVYFSLKHYGYTHYHVEMSKLVRANLMGREEALKALEINYDKALLDSIATKLNLRIE